MHQRTNPGTRNIPESLELELSLMAISETRIIVISDRITRMPEPPTLLFHMSVVSLFVVQLKQTTLSIIKVITIVCINYIGIVIN